MSENTIKGRGVANFVTLLGWLSVIGGGALVGYGLYNMFTTDLGLAATGPLLAGGAVTIALGLLCIINATMTKAMVDNANNTAKLIGGGASVTAADSFATTTEPAADADNTPSLDDDASATDDDPGLDLDEVERVSSSMTTTDTDIPPFDPAPAAPSEPPVVADTSDPRSWPLAIDEFDLDGHLAMTLEDGSVGVETVQGWRRLPNVDAARTWLVQQGL